jgi:predicted nucleic acid-binding protein
MIVVFDTNVVVEAIFWPRSTARRALTGLAKRRFRTALNSAIMEEYATITAQIREKLFPETQPSWALAWIASKSLHIEPRH